MNDARPLKIAVIGHIRHPIARPFMGGMEAHCWHLCRALAARGHDITLFASGDSDSAGALVPLLNRHYDADLPWHAWHGTDELNAVLDRAFADILDPLATGGFDVIHNNSLHRFPPRFARRDGVAMVTSLHVPPFAVLQRAVQGSAAPWSRFTVCSQIQRSRWWPDGAPAEAHVVSNGIDLAEWPFCGVAQDRAVWSGRITPTKGAEIAIQAAKTAGIRLTLFGTIENRDYFEAQIRPHLSDDILYGGHVSQAALARHIGAASVFLFTPLWDEPFGLVAAEAMACGTPVAALPSGAVREVVEDGGVVALDKTPDALVAALQQARRIPRRTVRARAVQQFSRDRMVDRYEAIYRTAIAARTLAGTTVPPKRFSDIELPQASPTPFHKMATQ